MRDSLAAIWRRMSASLLRSSWYSGLNCAVCRAGWRAGALRFRLAVFICVELLVQICHLVADAHDVGILVGVGQQQRVQLHCSSSSCPRYRLSRVCTAVTADSPESCEVMALSRERCSISDVRVCSTAYAAR